MSVRLGTGIFPSFLRSWWGNEGWVLFQFNHLALPVCLLVGIPQRLIKGGLIWIKSSVIKDIKNYLNSICDLVCSLEVKDD